MYSEILADYLTYILTFCLVFYLAQGSGPDRQRASELVRSGSPLGSRQARYRAVVYMTMVKKLTITFCGVW